MVNVLVLWTTQSLSELFSSAFIVWKPSGTIQNEQVRLCAYETSQKLGGQNRPALAEPALGQPVAQPAHLIAASAWQLCLPTSGLALRWGLQDFVGATKLGIWNHKYSQIQRVWWILTLFSQWKHHCGHSRPLGRHVPKEGWGLGSDQLCEIPWCPGAGWSRQTAGHGVWGKVLG